MPFRTRKAGLKSVNGRLVSAKSKTGDPQCSEAMSAKVNARLGNPISMALDVANKVLGRCRSAARRLKQGALHRSAGNEAKAQHQEHIARSGGPVTAKERAAKAREIMAQRAASEAPATIGGEKPGERFSLLQRSATSNVKAAVDRGKGRTPFMFDMKRGDLPGQTSILDRAAILDTKTGAVVRPGKSVARLAGAPPAEKIRPATRTPPKEAMKPSRTKTAARLADALKARREQRAPETYGQPGKTYEMKTSAVNFDPDRFQYKLAAQGQHGVTDQLKGVEKWDSELAGVVSVWRDPANGKTFVVNGHHRMDLAKKLGVKSVTVKYLQAKTAEEARAKGALVNIAEGRGSAIDAAKFYRDTGIDAASLKAKGISMKEHTASQGLALAGLEDSAFKRVVNGELSTNRAAIIGGSGLSHEQQRQVLKLADKNPKLTDGSVRNLVDAAKAAGSRKKETRDLFGSTVEEESLVVHRASLEDKIKRTLSGDKRLFGLVSKSKHAQSLAERGGSQIDTAATGGVSQEAAETLHFFDQLKHRDPRLSKILNEGAERLANGESAKSVEQEVRRRATAHLKALLSGDVNPFD